MERHIESSKLNNGYLLETVRIFQGTDGQTQEKREFLLIRKHSGEPNLLDRTLTLRNIVKRDIEVPAIAVLEGRFIGDTGEIRFNRVLSPSELLKELREAQMHQLHNNH